MVSGRLYLHDHQRTQESKQLSALAIGVAVDILVQLRIPQPVPFEFNAPALADRPSSASGLVRSLVMK